MPKSLQERRARVTVDSATEILRVFGLKEFPRSIPYSDEYNIHLSLPDVLTGKEIRVIAASARIYQAYFCLADLSLWLLKHPDAAYSHRDIWNRWQRTGIKKQTLDNYQTVAKAFPAKDRVPQLAYGFHDAAKTLPRNIRKEMMLQAVREHITVGEFRQLAQVRKMELTMGKNRKPQDRRRILLLEISKASLRGSAWTRKARAQRGLTPAQTQQMDEDLSNLVTLIAEMKKLKS